MKMINSFVLGLVVLTRGQPSQQPKDLARNAAGCIRLEVRTPTISKRWPSRREKPRLWRRKIIKGTFKVLSLESDLVGWAGVVSSPNANTCTPGSGMTLVADATAGHRRLVSRSLLALVGLAICALIGAQVDSSCGQP